MHRHTLFDTLSSFLVTSSTTVMFTVHIVELNFILELKSSNSVIIITALLRSVERVSLQKIQHFHQYLKTVGLFSQPIQSKFDCVKRNRELPRGVMALL